MPKNAVLFCRKRAVFIINRYGRIRLDIVFDHLTRYKRFNVRLNKSLYRSCAVNGIERLLYYLLGGGVGHLNVYALFLKSFGYFLNL